MMGPFVTVSNVIQMLIRCTGRVARRLSFGDRPRACVKDSRPMRVPRGINDRVEYMDLMSVSSSHHVCRDACTCFSCMCLMHVLPVIRGVCVPPSHWLRLGATHTVRYSRLVGGEYRSSKRSRYCVV
ncbi:hypothetical protein CONLIGDRAFT_351521 [Coniochaeta ligniaria NRRL 30616]|uniref:Uncharacterized protein n=1 Tax=Coniochaeta ligniaria NRRL 30616 TaxID=1408157 RepID=A0A1J7IQK5_9PEZI|nr:hypothetical protein CONLIGDRAFT_351521 [Coniochaeta ligniaria NRRL 30616]